MISRSQKQALVWGGLMILFGVMALVEVYINLGPWIWVVVLAGAGLGILGLYFSDRSEGWPLIPGYVLLALAGLIALITLNILQDEAVAFYVLTAIALPFLVVYLRNRQQWWALIPAYVLFAVGLMVALIGADILSDLLVPGYVMFAIAIPFFVVYANNPKQWWALIPGGVLTIIGISFFIAEAAVQFIGPAVLIILGIWILARQFTRKETKPELSGEMSDEPPAE